MSGEKQEWFVAERARALAMVHLTRRTDLVVRKASEGVGLEFLVAITNERAEQSVRQLGVVQGGRKTAVMPAELDRVLRPTMQSLRRIRPFPYPVCLFHFSMDDDRGDYTWVAEPAVTEAGPRLLMHEAAHCQKLDPATLAENIAKVEGWYDAFFSQIPVQAS